MANIPKIQKALYPHIPKIDPSILYPFKYFQNIPYPFNCLANIPVFLKTLPGPQQLLMNMKKKFGFTIRV